MIPRTMIDGIRRRLEKSAGKDPWDADQEFEPEEVDAPSVLSTDTAVLFAAAQAETVSNDLNPLDYYKNLVRTAIENGGRYAGHQISIPWLRMTLAGLELKRVDPEMLWEGVDGGAPDDGLPAIPSYNDLFPSDRDAPSGPGLP